MNENSICWFEIYVDDLQRAKKFYSEVLGTAFHDMQSPGGSDEFKMSCFSSSENQGVSGALVQTKETRINNPANLSTIVYFPCNDCSIEESRVEKAGGKVTCPKMSLGEHGFITMCIDTENNTFGLYSMQ